MCNTYKPCTYGGQMADKRTAENMGMENLRAGLTDAIETVKQGTPIRVTYYGRLVCVMMPPAMAARCFEALDRASEPRK